MPFRVATLSGESVILLGDGQCDSPGDNAKYLTYTVMHEDTDLNLASKTVCVGEWCVANSNAMEVEGLHRCLQEVVAHHVNIRYVATERHPQVSKYMRTQRPTTDHQYEVFHTAKGVTKELTRLLNTRDTDVVQNGYSPFPAISGGAMLPAMKTNW